MLRREAARWGIAASSLLASSLAWAAPPAPTRATCADAPWDDGTAVIVDWTVGDESGIAGYRVFRLRSPEEAAESNRKLRVQAADNAWTAALQANPADPQRWELARAAAEKAAREATANEPEPYELVAFVPTGGRSARIDTLPAGRPQSFRVRAVDAAGAVSEPAEAGTTTPVAQMFVGSRIWFAPLLVGLCATIVGAIGLARAGRVPKVRRIAGLDAMDEAIGRATEMGRPVLYIPGIQDMDNVQTVAGVTILGRVAKTAAEYEARLEVPTARSMVMTACRDAVQTAYYEAGRPDAYNPDAIRYITDEQFGYVAYVAGRMVREKPAACVYMGQFYAESLLLSENGNAINAIQIAGTAESSQLPFFVAACDYTLIGEEFFAASAYLSGEPTQMGSVFGQDVAKLAAAVTLLIGVLLATMGSLGSERAKAAADYLADTILSSG